jgi:hypothetical protein
LSAAPGFGQESRAADTTRHDDPRSIVKSNMHIVQTALEAWTVDHYGAYPNRQVSWAQGDAQGMAAYMPGGDPFGENGVPVAGKFPNNPFTGKEYESGRDLFYFPDTIAEPGVSSIATAADAKCPYIGLVAPAKVPGTILILGHPNEFGSTDEYGIAGYDADTTEPMYGIFPGPKPGDPEVKAFFVLHN